MHLRNLTSESWNFIIDHPEKLKQGVHLWYKGIPYPRRVYYDRLNDPNYTLRALAAINSVKKFLISFAYLANLVLPNPFKLKRWGSVVDRLTELFTYQLAEFLLKDNEWSVPVWEMGKGIKIFLKELGFNQELSKIVMCILEFDNAYRHLPQDMAGETTKQALLNNPRKELKRLYKILVSRDIIGPGKEWNVYERIGKFVTPLLWLLWIPKVKRAFKKAVKGIELKNIRFDNNDRFHFAFWKGYNYEGRTFDQRFKPYEEIYKNSPFQKREDPKLTADFLTGK